MNFLLLIFAAACLALGFLIPEVKNKERKEKAYEAATWEERHRGEVKWERYNGNAPAVCFLLTIVLVLLSASFVMIPTGYTGVRTTFGQIDSTPVRNGFNWKIPFVQSVERVNNKQQDVKFKDKVWAETSERTAIYYEHVTVTYQINPEMSAWIYANVSNYKDSLVSQDLIASAIKSSSKVLSDTDATNRAIVEPLILENAQKSLDEKYGGRVVIVNKVTVNNVDFDDAYNKAIAERQQAVLEAEKQSVINKREIEKAEAAAAIKRTEAEAAADVKLTNAKAEADSIRMKADAQAEANKKLAQSLTSELLENKKLEQWDGKLPTVSGSGVPIISIDP